MQIYCQQENHIFDMWNLKHVVGENTVTQQNIINIKCFPFLNMRGVAALLCHIG